jgi:hypothetical protein
MKQEMSARANRVFLTAAEGKFDQMPPSSLRGRRGAGSTADGQPKQNSLKDKRSPAFLRGHEALKQLRSI